MLRPTSTTSSSGMAGRHNSHHEGQGGLHHHHQATSRDHPQRPYGGSFGSSGGLPQQGNSRPQVKNNDFGASSCLRPTLRASHSHNTTSTMSARSTAQPMPHTRSHHPPLLACMVPSTAVSSSSSSKGSGAVRRPSMDEEDSASLRTFNNNTNNKGAVSHKKYNNKKLHIPGASTLSSMGTSLVEMATKPRGSNAGKVCL